MIKGIMLTVAMSVGADLALSQGLVLPQGWENAAEWDDQGAINAFADPLPARWDWREHAVLSPIKNQGQCGSCWAFATTSVTESLSRMVRPWETLARDLAEQTLVSTCSNAGTCSGGYFEAFEFIKKVGLPTEKDDPYVGRNTACKPSLMMVANISRWAYVGTQGRVPTTVELKRAIYDHGPIAVAVHGRLPSSRNGVVTQCGSNMLTHMVVIEGWVDDPKLARNGGGYWIMRNSWGNQWSEAGYMRIAYNVTGSTAKCFGIGNVAAYAVMDGVENLREHLGIKNDEPK